MGGPYAIYPDYILSPAIPHRLNRDSILCISGIYTRHTSTTQDCIAVSYQTIISHVNDLFPPTKWTWKQYKITSSGWTLYLLNSIKFYAYHPFIYLLFSDISQRFIYPVVKFPQIQPPSYACYDEIEQILIKMSLINYFIIAENIDVFAKFIKG